MSSRSSSRSRSRSSVAPAPVIVQAGVPARVVNCSTALLTPSSSWSEASYGSIHVDQMRSTLVRHRLGTSTVIGRKRKSEMISMLIDSTLPFPNSGEDADLWAATVGPVDQAALDRVRTNEEVAVRVPMYQAPTIPAADTTAMTTFFSNMFTAFGNAQAQAAARTVAAASGGGGGGTTVAVSTSSTTVPPIGVSNGTGNSNNTPISDSTNSSTATTDQKVVDENMVFPRFKFMDETLQGLPDTVLTAAKEGKLVPLYKVLPNKTAAI